MRPPVNAVVDNNYFHVPYHNWLRETENDLKEFTSVLDLKVNLAYNIAIISTAYK